MDVDPKSVRLPACAAIVSHDVPLPDPSLSSLPLYSAPSEGEFLRSCACSLVRGLRPHPKGIPPPVALSRPPRQCRQRCKSLFNTFEFFLCQVLETQHAIAGVFVRADDLIKLELDRRTLSCPDKSSVASRCRTVRRRRQPRLYHPLPAWSVESPPNPAAAIYDGTPTREGFRRRASELY
jgi:hypothetical protein